MFSPKSFLRTAFSAVSFKGLGEFFASLGAWGGEEQKKKKRKKKIEQIAAVSPEPIPVSMVSRLREEMIGASLADEVKQRAIRLKRIRDEDEELLLMLT